VSKRVVVVGGGPKGIALAAKAAALEATGRLKDVELVVLEQHRVGAHWDGWHGFTDGAQRLVTEPERDVGFPYFKDAFGSSLVRVMFEQYSWPAFCVDHPERPYHTWLDKGRMHPTNREWAQYLRWVAQRVRERSQQVRICEGAHVIGMASADGRLTLNVLEDGAMRPLECDAVVITGPGDPIDLRPPSPIHPRVFNAKTFWPNADACCREKNTDVPFVVMGSGGAAANVVIELIRRRGSRRIPIVIVSEAGAIFSRGEGYFEKRYYSDPAHWRKLSADARLEIMKRGDRGVVTFKSLEAIFREDDVELETVQEASIQATGDPSEPLSIEAQGGGGLALSIPTDYVVVAIGFDPWSFVRLMEGALGEGCRRYRSQLDQYRRSDPPPDLEIARDFSLPRAFTAGAAVHAPMLAGLTCGPGFPNLCCLGLLADRILASYVDMYVRT